ncbi:MAG: spore coat protein U domain-containing protein [Erythrobacter sp.]
MKHFQLAIIAGTLAASTSALGQNLNYSLEADVAQACGAFNGQASAIDVDFGALANTRADAQTERRAGSITYRCNNRNGFTRVIASQNGGFMTLNGDATTDRAQRIAFTMQHTGPHGFRPQQLTTPLVTSHRDARGAGDFLRGSDGMVLFRASGVQIPAQGGAPASTSVFAGTYRDTVTITVTAN